MPLHQVIAIARMQLEAPLAAVFVKGDVGPNGVLKRDQ